MPPTNSERPQIQIVLSRDHGELFNAVFFEERSDVDVQLLMPPAMYELNRHDIEIACEAYDSHESLTGMIRQSKPDVVLLFSGYLFVMNGLLTTAELSQLVQTLHAESIAMATSDPFLGLLSPASLTNVALQHPTANLLRDQFAQVTAVLQNIAHVSHAPCDAACGTSHHSFFNHRFADQQSTAVEPKRCEHSAPEWLFVLSTEDYGMQCRDCGSVDAFIQFLTQRLRETADCGRLPVVIAPQTCLENLSGATPPITGLRCFSWLGIRQFQGLLNQAEAAFYWNQFSASVLHRVLLRRPVFLFDRGHLSKAIPAFYDHACRHFYRGHQIPFLDLTQPLTEDAVMTLGQMQIDGILQPGIDHLSTSPTPKQLINKLLSAS